MERAADAMVTEASAAVEAMTAHSLVVEEGRAVRTNAIAHSPRRRDKKSENDTCIYERAFVTSLTSPSVSEGLRDPSSASTLRHINFVGHGIMFT